MLFGLVSPQIFSSAVTKDFISTFARQDNWHNLDPKTGNLGYGGIHYFLIRACQWERILCVGSRYGFIPAVCALACRDTGRGVVDFVDAGYGPGDAGYWGGAGYWKTDQVKGAFAKFGLTKYVNFQMMTTAEYLKKNRSQAWQYIHLDGDHSYKGVKFDFDHFWPKLENGGILGLHDIHTPDEDGNVYGVRKFWQELKAKKKCSMIEFPGKYGLGLIQKE